MTHICATFGSLLLAIDTSLDYPQLISPDITGKILDKMMIINIMLIQKTRGESWTKLVS